ncbi:MAG: serine hydrolase [Planctomycetota bacterium]
MLAVAFRNPRYNKPGAAWHYSNASSTLLGLAAENATGQSLATIIDRKVCKPLGLKSTGLCTEPSPPSPSPKAYRHGKAGRWLGYGDSFVEVTGFSASWAGVGGDMYSTVADLGIATRALATGGLLSDSSSSELLSWQPTFWPGVDYGFLINRNPRGVGHEGNVPGFQAVARYQEQKQRTIVVLTNLSNNADGSMPAETLFDLVVDHLDQKALSPPTATRSAAPE